MKWKTTRALLVILFFTAILSSGVGCSLTQVEKISQKVSDSAEKLSVAAPPSIKPILTAIAAMSALIASTTTAIIQYQEKIKMRKAIVAKADQIDKVILASTGNPDPEKKPILDFLRADMRLATGSRKSALNHFDKVRKGL